MAPISIEKITSHNFDSAWPLIDECIRSYGLEAFDVLEYRKFFLHFTQNTQAGVQHVCRMNEIAIGFSTVYFTFSSYYACQVAFINDLYVAAEFRGKGVGKALLENVRDMAKGRGLTLVQWLVRPDNVAAQRFYEPLNTISATWVRHSWRV